MQMFRNLSLEKRNAVLQSLYVHPLLTSGVECGNSFDGAGLFSCDLEQFSSQLLVTVNRLSSDEAGIESVRFCLFYFLLFYLCPCSSVTLLVG